MIEVKPTEVTDSLRALFRMDAPAGFRAFAVMDGDNRGKIWTDDLQNPIYGIVQEGAFGTLYLAGSFPAGLLADFVLERQQHGEVLYGFWAEDAALESQLPPVRYNGHVLENTARLASVDLTTFMQQLPADCQIRPLDAELFPRTEGYPFYTDMFGSAERALERVIGFCLMRGDALLCESFAGTSAGGIIEMGVDTLEGYRRQGYAAITCAHVIHEAEKRGLQTYWNCAEQNLASTKLALKLGYQPMRRYRLLGWWS